jgi:hypothetical protein
MDAAVNLRPDGSRWDQLSLVREADNATREAIMHNGSAPELRELCGWEYAGINTAWIAGLGGVRKFKKGFYEGPARGTGPEPFVQGYNVPVRQNGVGQPHVAKPSDEHPKRFGFYRVHAVSLGSRDAKYPAGLLLDYSRGGNFALDPANLLRDYLVQVYPDDPELLLGHAFGALLGLRIPISFFVLRRMNQHSFGGR